MKLGPCASRVQGDHHENMEDEQAVESSDTSFPRSWKSLKDAVRRRLEPKSRRTSVVSSADSGTEAVTDASPITRSSSSAVRQRLAKGPLSALYKPKPFKVPRYGVPMLCKLFTA